MEKLMERYIYDVVRRLPEGEQSEVRRELTANIQDMLPPEGGEEALREVLIELGAPSALAEKYRARARYLISPAIYDAYIRSLKWILPLAGVITALLGVIFGLLEAVSENMAESARFVTVILAKGISFGVSGTVQSLIWTTIGFVIAERVGYRQDEDSWRPEDLPGELPPSKSRIPLSDSIAELVLVTVFSVLGILLCNGDVPYAFLIQGGSLQAFRVFSPAFLAACIPAIAVVGGLMAMVSILKIVIRRWTPLVCVSVIVSDMIGLVWLLRLVTRPDLLAPECAAFLQNANWGEVALSRFARHGVDNPLVALVIVVAVIASVWECVAVVCRTVRASQGSEDAL